MKDITRKIDDMRVKQGLTIYEFCNRVGIVQQTYHQWLDTNTTPTLSKLQKICDYFNISLSELFAKNNFIELSPDLKTLYNNWILLSKEEQDSIRQIIGNYINNKNK